MTKTQGKRRIDLGVLYSRSGSYALIARACRTGALKAVEEVNADPTLDIAFTPVMRDPQGNTDAYAPLCEEILRTSKDGAVMLYRTVEDDCLVDRLGFHGHFKRMDKESEIATDLDRSRQYRHVHFYRISHAS